MKRLAYLFLALGLALWAQRWLTGGGFLHDAAILFVLAAAIFVVQVQAPRPWPDLLLRRAGTRLGWLLVALGLGLAGLATALFWGDPQSNGALLLWLASIPLFLTGAYQERQADVIEPAGLVEAEQASPLAPHGSVPSPSRLLAFAARLPADKRWEYGLLAVILLLAIFARFYQLDAVPNGCQSDECNNGLDAVRWLEGAPYTVYAETNEGQATLFTYLLALSFKLFGIGVLQMRLVSAFIGVLTVLAFYFLSRDLFSRPIALAATALLAAARWHITFSRIIYELILTPLAEILLFFFLLRALRWGRRRDWALAGLVLGGGMHTYTAWRVMPFLIGLYLVYWLISHRDRWRRDLEGVAYLAGGAAVSVAPLGVYIIQHWNVFISRTQHISVFQDIERANSLEPLWSNLRKTLLMFNYQGDGGSLNNLPGAPLVPFDVRSAGAIMSRVPEAWLLASLAAALFVLGVVYALRFAAHPVPFLVLTAFVFVGSVAVLSVAHEAPTARRPIALTPLIFLLVAMAVDQFWLAFRRAFDGRAGRAFNTVLAVAVVGICLGNLDTYFNVQAKNQSVYIAYSGVEAAVGQYVHTLPEKARIYLVPAFYNHSAVKLIGGRRDAMLLNLGQDLPLREDPGGDVVYIVEATDQRVVSLFRQFYPQGQLVEHRDPYGRLYFVAYRVSGEQVTASRGLSATYYQGNQWEMGLVALRRTDGPLDFDWRANPPGALPFSVQWSGSLLVPAFGTYRFGAETSPTSQFSMTVAGVTVVDSAAGRLNGETRLVAGFHQVTMRYRSGTDLGRLTVTWEGPNTPRTTIPLNVLYSIAAPPNGLVGYYYRTIDWSGPPSLIEKDTLILPNDPFGGRVSIVWKGKIAAPTTGVYVFGTRSDDGSLVYIDGKMVVDNGSPHGSTYREGSIQLTKGFHDIEVRYFQDGGSRDMQLSWAPPGLTREIIPTEYLFPLEGSEIPADLALPPVPAPPAQPLVSPTPALSPGAPGSPTATKPDSPTVAVGAAPAMAVNLLWQAGSCGAGEGELQSPRGAAADSVGNVYVADAGNHRVVKLNPDGKVLLAWGREGAGDGEFMEPFDIVVEASGEIVVLDATAQTLQRFTPDGQFVARVGKDLPFYRPRGLGLNADGSLLVANTGRRRVAQVSAQGSIVQEYGGSGPLADMGQVVDVAAGPGGFLYVTEGQSGLIWRLGPGGDTRSWRATTPASTVDGPHVAVGPDGAIYVTDPEKWRVIIYDSAGTPLGQFGAKGAGAGQFQKPVGLAVGQNGLVYVVDSPACRVQAFSMIPK